MTLLNRLHCYILFSDFFPPYKEYIICLISCSKFSDVLPYFMSARVIGNLWSICLGANISIPFPFFSFVGDIPFLKALGVTSRLSKRVSVLSKVFRLLSLFSFDLGLDLLL